MSTSWKSVFDRFLTLVDDRALCDLLDDEDMTELLQLFLNGSLSLYFKNCTKDLTDIIEPKFLREVFAGNGSNKEFIISESISTYNSDSVSMFVSIDGTELSSDNYSYDDATKKFSLDDAPDNGAVVICGYNYIGEFNDTLDDEEVWILSQGMIVVWHSSKLFSAEKMKERLSSKDWNSPHSPANLLEKLLILRNQALKEIKSLTVSYSFNNFTGFN